MHPNDEVDNTESVERVEKKEGRVDAEISSKEYAPLLEILTISN